MRLVAVAEFERGGADCPTGRPATVVTATTEIAGAVGWRADPAAGLTMRRSPGGAVASVDLTLALLSADGAPLGTATLLAAHPDLAPGCVLPEAPNGQVPVTLVGPLVDAAGTTIGCGIVEASGGGLRLTTEVLLRGDPAGCDGASAQLVGSPAVGAPLTCSTGGWDAPPTIAWLRDGTTIATAAGSTYEVSVADAKHRLQCVASGLHGGVPLTRSSGPLTVPGAAPATGIAVLGDSLSAGVGAGDEVGPCQRSPNAYVANIVRRMPIDTPVVHVACAGATTVDVSNSVPGRGAQLAELSAAAAAIDTIYVSLGASDLGLDALLTRCLAAFRPLVACTDAAALAQREQELLAFEAPGSLVGVLRAIADAVPGAAIRIFDYPAPPDRPCASTAWLGESDLRTLRELVVERANTVVRRAVLLAGGLGLDVRLVEVESALAEHALCDPGSTVNGVALGSFPADVAGTFMPNASGQTQLGRAEEGGSRGPALRTVLTPDARLARGGVQRESILVEGGPLFVSVARNPGVTVALIRPDGAAETSARLLAVGDRDVLVVDDPLAGMWSVELRADDSAAIDALGTIGRRPPIRLAVGAPEAALWPLAVARVRVRGSSVEVDADDSRIPAASATKASWDWGDDTPEATGMQASHRYRRAGAYRVTLTLTDAAGRVDLTRVVVVVGGRATRIRPALTLAKVRPRTNKVTVRLTCPRDAAFSCHAVALLRVAGGQSTTTEAVVGEPGKPLKMAVPIDPVDRERVRNRAARWLDLRVIIGDDSARGPVVLTRALKVLPPRRR